MQFLLGISFQNTETLQKKKKKKKKKTGISIFVKTTWAHKEINQVFATFCFLTLMAKLNILQ